MKWLYWCDKLENETGVSVWVLSVHKKFKNIEGLSEFNFELPNRTRRFGVSALVRVRNEAAKIELCIKSILPLFDEIVVVDNASDDDTAAIVGALKADFDPEDKIKLYDYPHRLARFGPEHNETHEASVHSAVYFTNWSLSKCTRRVVCKWDGDMVFKRSQSHGFRDFLQRVQDGDKACWMLSGQTLYRDKEQRLHLAMGDVNQDVEVFPNEAKCHFIKEANWEALNWRGRYKLKAFEPVTFYELKFVDEDEFDHWSTTEWPSKRKQREWENFCAVRDGAMKEGFFETLPPEFLEDQTAHGPQPPVNGRFRRATPRVIRDWVRYLRKRRIRSQGYFRRALRGSDVFLVGHPKSGNTWLAYMLAIAMNPQKAEAISLANVGEFVPYVHGQDWRISEFANLADPRVFRNENPMFPECYRRVIYLVRDPRSVIVSFWHMYRVMYDDNSLSLAGFVAQYMRGDGIFLSWNSKLERWDRQVERWICRAQAGEPVVVVKYEDLLADRLSELTRVCEFAGVSPVRSVMERAVELGDFGNMRRLESKHGAEAYRERSKGVGRFVRQGTVVGWRSEMPETIAREIESTFAAAMTIAGYQ